MHITTKKLSDTKREFTVVADEALLTSAKERVLQELSREVNMAGFRKGHAPKGLIEKSVDQELLQSRFLDAAMNDAYAQLIREQKLKPVAQPEVTLRKFVPFTTLELVLTVEAVGDITLPDYKKIKLPRKTEKVTEKDVAAVLDDLRSRDAEKKTVTRAARAGDEAVLDFTGVDAKTKQAIAGAEGKAYPLRLGSGAFIPGFEDEVVGLKAGDEKTFDITFPKDYGSADLQNKKVQFTITLQEVKELAVPKLDDVFVAKLGPFKSLDELKADIRTQLEAEKESRALREYENELLATIAEKSKLAVPDALINEEVERMDAEEKRNLTYRGQTWQEHLKAEGKTEEQHHKEQRELAEARVKTGLVLAEVAEKEQVNVTAPELQERLDDLKRRYTDESMQAELDKPENRREIASRLLTEKTIAVLVGYASQ